MAKLIRTTTDKKHLIWCPGCKCGHAFSTVTGGWVITGTDDKPTVNPSLLTRGVVTCHLFIKDGMIEFLNDCDHELKGQTVPMEKF